MRNSILASKALIVGAFAVGCAAPKIAQTKIQLPPKQVESAVDQLAILRGKFGLFVDTSTIKNTNVQIWNPCSMPGSNTVFFPIGRADVRYNLNYCDENEVGVLTKVEKKETELKRIWSVRITSSISSKATVQLSSTSGTLERWLFNRGAVVDRAIEKNPPSDLNVQQELACYYTSEHAPDTAVFFVNRNGEEERAGTLFADVNWQYNGSPLPTSDQEKALLAKGR